MEGVTSRQLVHITYDLFILTVQVIVPIVTILNFDAGTEANKVKGDERAEIQGNVGKDESCQAKQQLNSEGLRDTGLGDGEVGVETGHKLIIILWSFWFIEEETNAEQHIEKRF